MYFFFLWDRCRSYFLPKSNSNINLNCKYNKFRSYMRIWMWMDYYFWWNTHVIRTFNTNYKNFWKEQETQWMEAKMYEWININMYEKIYERERVSGIWERWSQHMINMSFIVSLQKGNHLSFVVSWESIHPKFPHSFYETDFFPSS